MRNSREKKDQKLRKIEKITHFICPKNIFEIKGEEKRQLADNLNRDRVDGEFLNAEVV